VRLICYSLVKERPPRQQRAAINAGAKTLIYIHWRCAVRREPGAHRRHANRGFVSKFTENISGFLILRGAPTACQTRRSEFTIVSADPTNARHPERTREGSASLVDRCQILREYAQDDKLLILIAQ